MRISDWSSDVCSSDLSVTVTYAVWSPTVTVRVCAASVTLSSAGVMVITPLPSSPIVTLPEKVSVPLAAVHTNVAPRSEEHTSELQSLMRISYAVFCLKQKKTQKFIGIIYTPNIHSLHTSHHVYT